MRQLVCLAALLTACGSNAGSGLDGGGADLAGPGGSDGGNPGSDGGTSEPCSDPVVADPDVMPQLPALIDTTFPTQTGNTVDVAQGGDLQAALNNAQPGDTIRLAAGATFTGPFTLPNKTGNGWIVITTNDAQLPPPGTRVAPADAAHMPKI